MSVEQLNDLLVRELEGPELNVAASILYQSYHDDPLFMTIFQADKADYEKKLRAAIREELSAFWQSSQTIIGLFQSEQLIGVACLVKASSGLGGHRYWHWRLKMLLTAGYVSTRQLLEKEERIHAAMPAKDYHMLAFIAVSPRHQQLGLGHQLLRAVDQLVDQDSTSSGVGVFVTLEKYLPFFAGDAYQAVTELSFNTVQGKLLFRPKQPQT
ncbi:MULTISPECIES: GNAT family N-acetyltransferase [Alkalimonas]|uniref:GNAT family N-acetyltransferase n=1 Tax=Alkalimonas mucilaginosa TaxID=3057676 RepID=A0ABU7JG03_9GAMM|nr:GNAT family N-acetyltransferase [Alkalimonas sp. MEB004]MEE2024612.1 GNAT family N-acetyltransferase [Alkalimonas sp. MEB004]